MHQSNHINHDINLSANLDREHWSRFFHIKTKYFELKLHKYHYNVAKSVKLRVMTNLSNNNNDNETSSSHKSKIQYELGAHNYY